SAPAVNRLLPPRSSKGAASRTRTRAPCPRAAKAAHMPALPAPTTTTSNSPAIISFPPLGFAGNGVARPAGKGQASLAGVSSLLFPRGREEFAFFSRKLLIERELSQVAPCLAGKQQGGAASGDRSLDERAPRASSLWVEATAVDTSRARMKISSIMTIG